MIRWAVFVSGRGSNLQALLDQNEFRIVLVVTSNSKAPGVLKAKRLGIPVIVFTKKDSWLALSDELKQRRVQKIFLAGFMRLIPEDFVTTWSHKMLNVHPSLLPLFPGLNAIEQSYNSAENMGVTVHVVVPEMDAGPIVLKKVAHRREKTDNSKQSMQEALTLSEAEFLISNTEQFLVREAFRRWNSWN